jgi:chromosome segregation ATPase
MEFVAPRIRLASIAAVSAGVALTLPAVAQVARQGGSTANANAQLMQQYQQASAARDSLQAENAQLKQHAEQLQKQLDAATNSQAAADKKATGLQQQAKRDAESQKTATAANEKLQGQMAEVVKHYREMAQQLKDVEVDRGNLRTKLADSDRRLNSCIDNNAHMYLLSEDILNHLEHRGGFWSGVAEKEPFTRLSRMRLENLADDYRQRIAELRVPATAANPPAAQPVATHDTQKP